ncbi:MAG: HPr family phosphocarrier protein [Butyrivibrio sp.]|nr:HPr family phosphocarrier protein [Mogibacterium sp.]MBP3199393.1 HPr family phosphocarrier protein [Butyrivibrio sp.]
MYKQETTIVNRTGLHARPATEFVNCAKKFESKITIQRAGEESEKAFNAKSMVTLLTLALKKGESVIICADGSDEVEAVDTLVSLLQEGFGEE